MHYLKLRYSQFMGKHRTQSRLESKPQPEKQFEFLKTSVVVDEAIDTDFEMEVELSRIFDLQFLVGDSFEGFLKKFDSYHEV